MSVRLAAQCGLGGEPLFPYLNWPPEARLSWLKLTMPKSTVLDAIVPGSLNDSMSALPTAPAVEEMLSFRPSREGERPDTEWVPCCRRSARGSSKLWPWL
jgi:hypothetical protein